MATPLSSRQLAKIAGITEREVENHISHITQQVDYWNVWNHWNSYRGEDITEPQYSIERHSPKQN